MSIQVYLYVQSEADIPPERTRAWLEVAGDTPHQGDATPSSIVLKDWSTYVTEPVTDVVCVFPTHWATTLSIAMPSNRRRVLHRALRYAAEDFLVEAIDNYHVAVLGQERNNDYAVSLVKKQLMEDWRDFFRLRAPKAHVAFVLDGWLIPINKTDLPLWVTETGVLIRTGIGKCVSVDSSQLPLLTISIAAEYPELGARFADFVPNEDLPEYKVSPKSVLDRAAHHTPNIDLYAGQTSEKVAQTLRIALNLVVGSLVLALSIASLGFVYTASQYRTIADATLRETHSLYESTFSQEGNVINPVLQAGRKLAALKDQWKPEKVDLGFVPMLALASRALVPWTAKGANALIRLNYNESAQEMTINVSTASVESVNDLNNAIAQQLLGVRTSNISKTDDTVTARIHLTPETGHDSAPAD